MEAFHVNKHHQSIIEGYTQLNRYQRQQFLRSVEFLVKNVIDSKLLEDTYTRDELIDILTNIRKTVVDDIEAEIIHSNQTNVLMLYQLFQQAEKWHLQLNVDLSEIQNKKLLEALKNIDNSTTIQLEKPKLVPLSTNIEKTSEILRLEILTLQEDKKQAMDEIQNLKTNISDSLRENERICLKLEEKDERIKELERIIDKHSNSRDEKVENNETLDAEKILEDYDKVLKVQISNELQEMKNEVQTAQSQLVLAEMELEKKFSNTAAYNNMKMLICKKNDQIKKLRNRLAQHETLNDLENGEVE